MKEIGVGCLLLYVLGFGSGVIWALSGTGEGYVEGVHTARVEAVGTEVVVGVEAGTFTRNGRNGREDKRYYIDSLEGRTEQDAKD